MPESTAVAAPAGAAAAGALTIHGDSIGVAPMPLGAGTSATTAPQQHAPHRQSANGTPLAVVHTDGRFWLGRRAIRRLASWPKLGLQRSSAPPFYACHVIPPLPPARVLCAPQRAALPYHRCTPEKWHHWCWCAPFRVGVGAPVITGRAVSSRPALPLRRGQGGDGTGDEPGSAHLGHPPERLRRSARRGMGRGSRRGSRPMGRGAMLENAGAEPTTLWNRNTSGHIGRWVADSWSRSIGPAGPSGRQVADGGPCAISSECVERNCWLRGCHRHTGISRTTRCQPVAMARATLHGCRHLGLLHRETQALRSVCACRPAACG